MFWTGLALGGMYALVSLQFDLVYAATGIFNFAQLGLIVVAAFVGAVLLGDAGLPWAVVLVVLAAGGALFGASQELFTIRTLDRRGLAGSHAWMVTTIGIGTALQGLALLVWGIDPRVVPFIGSNRPLTILGGRVRPVELTVVGVAIVAALIMRTLLMRTRAGLATLATAADRDLAMLRGVNVSRVSIGSFAVAGAMVSASILFIAPMTFASLEMGHRLVVFAFAALAVGGFGTQWGALLGGLSTGLVEAYSTYRWGAGAGPVMVLVLLLVVLLVRPRGFFATPHARVI